MRAPSLALSFPLAFAALASPAMADCKDDIIAVMDRSSLAGPYRTEAALTAGERKATIVSQVVPPGDLHTKMTVGSVTKEMMKIGDQVWVNEGKGWRLAPPAIAARIGQMTSGIKTVAPNLINDVDCPGARTVEGRSLTVYTYKMDVPGGKASSSNTLYVDPESRLPAKITVEGRTGQMKSLTEISYVYDPKIVLTAPVTEAPAKQP